MSITEQFFIFALLVLGGVGWLLYVRTLADYSRRLFDLGQARKGVKETEWIEVTIEVWDKDSKPAKGLEVALFWDVDLCVPVGRQMTDTAGEARFLVEAGRHYFLICAERQHILTFSREHKKATILHREFG